MPALIAAGNIYRFREGAEALPYGVVICEAERIYPLPTAGDEMTEKREGAEALPYGVIPSDRRESRDLRRWSVFVGEG